MKADWLKEFHHVLLIAALGTAAVCAVGAVDLIVNDEIVVELQAGSAGAQGLDPSTPVVLAVSDPSATQVTLATVAALPTYLLVTAMLLLLHRLVGAARCGDPLFTGRTVGRVRTVGWLLLVGGPVAGALEFVARFALSGTVGSGPNFAVLDPARTMIWMLTGFGLLAVAEVVRRGQALRAELDEVI